MRALLKHDARELSRFSKARLNSSLDGKVARRRRLYLRCPLAHGNELGLVGKSIIRATSFVLGIFLCRELYEHK